MSTEESIRALAEQGSTAPEIAQELGISKSVVYYLASQERISLPRGRKGPPSVTGNRPRLQLPQNIQATIIQDELQQGERSLEVLCQKAGCGIAKFTFLRKQYQIVLPEDIIPCRHRPEIDTLFDEGFSANDIAARVLKKDGTPMTRQAVHQYADQSGQKYYWRQQQVKYKFSTHEDKNKMIQLRQHILYCLEEHIKVKAHEQGWAYEKMVEADFSRRKNPDNIPLEKILLFFQRYEQTLQEGKPPSLKELSKGYFHFSSASTFLRQIGIKPPLGRKYRPSSQILAKKKELVRRGGSTVLPEKDIAYFTNIYVGSVYNYFEQQGGRRHPAERLRIKYSGFGGTKSVLTYRLASQIYESIDACRFTLEETTILLDIPLNVVEHALEQKTAISATIIDALRIMYPQASIAVPYFQAGERPMMRDAAQEAVNLACAQLSWSGADVARFLGIGCQLVQNYYRQQGKRPIKFLKFDPKNKVILTRFSASRIYLLQDEGVSKAQIKRKVQTSAATIEYALQHRAEYEPELIVGLRVLFPGEKIIKPYRISQER